MNEAIFNLSLSIPKIVLSDFLDSNCEFNSDTTKHWTHFPHSAQIFHSCISLWNGNSGPSVLAWSFKYHMHIIRGNKFSRGIIGSLMFSNNCTLLDLGIVGMGPRPNNTLTPLLLDGLGYTVQSQIHLQAFRDATAKRMFSQFSAHHFWLSFQYKQCTTNWDSEQTKQ